MEIDRAVESLGQGGGGGVVGCLICFRATFEAQINQCKLYILNMCMFSCIRPHNIVVHRECGVIICGKNVFFVVVTAVSASNCKITLTSTPDGSIGWVVMAGICDTMSLNKPFDLDM